MNENFLKAILVLNGVFALFIIGFCWYWYWLWVPYMVLSVAGSILAILKLKNKI